VVVLTECVCVWGGDTVGMSSCDTVSLALLLVVLLQVLPQCGVCVGPGCYSQPQGTGQQQQQ